MKDSKSSYPTIDEYAPKVAAKPQSCGGYRTKGGIARTDLPLVSIITVTYNARKTLSRTLESVRMQTYRNIEHIIVDGGSTDGTVSLLQANEDAIAYWRCERDDGIYDAFNKGVALAKGDFIGILNADDYYELNQVENAVATLIKTGAPFVHGDITLHGWQGQDVQIFGDPHYSLKIREKMPSLHQVTTLCRREVFEKYGLFSTRYRIAGDFDWYLRLANKGCIGTHSPLIRAHMVAGGVSTTQQRRAFCEALLITARHGLSSYDAAKITLPRIIFPNGTPGYFRMVAGAIRHPTVSLSNVVSRLKNRGVQTEKKNTNTAGLPLLLAFVSARQSTLTIDPLGIEWIYGVGLRSRTFRNLSSSAQAQVLESLLTAAGAQRIGDNENPDVYIIGEELIADLCTSALVEAKTILAECSLPSAEKRRFPFTSLDLGSVLGIGLLVNPVVNLREPGR
jgi:glycosyltransferase involved in cell wall biosynthesis